MQKDGKDVEADLSINLKRIQSRVLNSVEKTFVIKMS